MTLTHTLLPVEGGELPLTVARSGGTGASVVILPSAFGVTADLEAQLEELAAHASLVAALDPFFRGDAGPVPYSDMARVMARLRAIEPPRCARDLRAAIDWARGQSGGRGVVVLGVCFGGPYALLAAADGAVEGAVTWHGTRMENFLPLRLHFGGADPIVPPPAVEAIRAAFSRHDDVRITVHEGATHGFSHRAAPAYDARAERAGMDSLRELIARVAEGGIGQPRARPPGL